MKKLLLSLSILSTVIAYSQAGLPKKINIYNYTSHNLYNFLIGSNQASGCYPSINATSAYEVPPMGAVSYTGYYNSQLASTPITTWGVQLSSTTNSTIQPSTSPVLMALGQTTDWQMNKFSLRDTSGGVLAWSGGSIGTITCGGPTVTNISPTPAEPWIFNAFWFVVSGETYFVIQP